MNPGIARIAIIIALVVGRRRRARQRLRRAQGVAAPPEDRRRPFGRPRTPSPTSSPRSLRRNVPNQRGRADRRSSTARRGRATPRDFQEMLVDRRVVRRRPGTGRRADTSPFAGLDRLLPAGGDSGAEPKPDAQLLSEGARGRSWSRTVAGGSSRTRTRSYRRGGRRRRPPEEDQTAIVSSPQHPFRRSPNALTISQSSSGRNGLVRNADAPNPCERSRSAPQRLGGEHQDRDVAGRSSLAGGVEDAVAADHRQHQVKDDRVRAGQRASSMALRRRPRLPGPRGPAAARFRRQSSRTSGSSSTTRTRAIALSSFPGRLVDRPTSLESSTVEGLVAGYPESGSCVERHRRS